MAHDDDPLLRLAGPLAAVLIAVALSVLIAAMIGGAMPFEYTGRAVTYLVLLLYVLAGAFMVVRTTFAAERQPISAARIAKWVLSIWLWPLLLLR